MDDNPPENDGVLHQGEEDQQHAGKQPDLGQPSQVIETSTLSPLTSIAVTALETGILVLNIKYLINIREESLYQIYFRRTFRTFNPKNAKYGIYFLSFMLRSRNIPISYLKGFNFFCLFQQFSRRALQEASL